MLTPVRLNTTIGCPSCFFDVKPIVVERKSDLKYTIVQCPIEDCKYEWEVSDADLKGVQ